MSEKKKNVGKKKGNSTKNEPIIVPQIKGTFDDAMSFLAAKQKQANTHKNSSTSTN